MTNNKENQELTEELFNKLYTENRNMVRQVVVEYENDPETVQELVQEVFARAWERRDQFRGEAQAGTWLYRIAANVGANHVRDVTERSPELVPEWALGPPHDDDSDGSWLEQNYRDYDDPESLLIAEEEAMLGYANLSRQEEQVFNLMYIQGLSATEAAAELGIARATLDVVVHRIKKKME